MKRQRPPLEGAPFEKNEEASVLGSTGSLVTSKRNLFKGRGILLEEPKGHLWKGREVPLGRIERAPSVGPRVFERTEGTPLLGCTLRHQLVSILLRKDAYMFQFGIH